MFGYYNGLCMQNEHSITATSQSLSSLVMHRCSLWGDANKGARAEGPPIQQKAAERNMAGATGKRNDEEERRRGGGATSLAWEFDPVTHKASRVKADGTDNHANSRADTHTRSCSAKVQTSSTGRTRPNTTSLDMLRLGSDRQSQARVWGFHTHRARGQAVTERSEATHHQTGFLLSVTYFHHVRGIKGLLQMHSHDWQADPQSCLPLFLCPEVPPQLSKL